MVHVNQKRTISINNPKLKIIRNALRFIISEAVMTKRSSLLDEKIQVDIYDERNKILADKIDKLYTSWNKSICVCPTCGSRTKDMTFNPWDKYWYCTKCYEENHNFHKSRNEVYKFP